MQSAFILHSRPYRDTSVILELFTFDYGRVTAIAKGAKGPRSKIRGLLQPFSPLVISTSGRSELAYLNKIECDGAPFQLSAHKLMHGIYLNQLLLKTLAKHDPHQQLFLIYRKALRLLSRQEEVASILRRFEWNLLEQLGYAINLEEDVNGHKIKEPTFYYYIPQQGFVPTTKIDHKVYQGKWLLAWKDKLYQYKEVLNISESVLLQALSATTN